MAHPFINKVTGHINTAAKIAGAAHTAYQIGKGLWSVGQAVAPYAALLL
jgi:hypothetical protein